MDIYYIFSTIIKMKIFLTKLEHKSGNETETNFGSGSGPYWNEYFGKRFYFGFVQQSNFEHF